MVAFQAIFDASLSPFGPKVASPIAGEGSMQPPLTALNLEDILEGEWNSLHAECFRQTW